MCANDVLRAMRGPNTDLCVIPVRDAAPPLPSHSDATHAMLAQQNERLRVWLSSEISREAAEASLQDASPGTFIVRRSKSSQADYAASPHAWPL